MLKLRFLGRNRHSLFIGRHVQFRWRNFSQQDIPDLFDILSVAPKPVVAPSKAKTNLFGNQDDKKLADVQNLFTAVKTNTAVKQPQIENPEGPKRTNPWEMLSQEFKIPDLQEKPTPPEEDVESIEEPTPPEEETEPIVSVPVELPTRSLDLLKDFEMRALQPDDYVPYTKWGTPPKFESKRRRRERLEREERWKEAKIRYTQWYPPQITKWFKYLDDPPGQFDCHGGWVPEQSAKELVSEVSASMKGKNRELDKIFEQERLEQEVEQEGEQEGEQSWAGIDLDNLLSTSDSPQQSGEQIQQAEGMKEIQTEMKEIQTEMKEIQTEIKEIQTEEIQTEEIDGDYGFGSDPLFAFHASIDEKVVYELDVGDADEPVTSFRNNPSSVIASHFAKSLKKKEIPDSLVEKRLRGKYFHGITLDDLRGRGVKLAELFAVKYAKPALQKKWKIADAVKTFGSESTNSGHPAVQVAVFTEKINSLFAHLKVHKKDLLAKKGLNHVTSKRKKAIQYLKRKDPAALYQVLHFYQVKDEPFQCDKRDILRRKF